MIRPLFVPPGPQSRGGQAKITWTTLPDGDGGATQGCGPAEGDIAEEGGVLALGGGGGTPAPPSLELASQNHWIHLLHHPPLLS